jgi:hypothetical protein
MVPTQTSCGPTKVIVAPSYDYVPDRTQVTISSPDGPFRSLKTSVSAKGLTMAKRRARTPFSA